MGIHLRNFLKITLALSLLLTIAMGTAHAAVIVTPSSGGSNLCVSGGFVGLGTLTINEGIVGDFNAPATVDLVLPSGFVYNTAAAVVVNISGTEAVLLSSAFLDASRYRFSVNITGITELNGITISGLQVRAVGPATLSDLIIEESTGNFVGLNGSTGAGLSSLNAPSILSGPSDKTVCAGASTFFTISASGTSLLYQWQRNDGGGFVNINSLTDGGTYSGFTSSNLTLANTAGLNNYRYRCIVTENGSSCSTTSVEALLTVNELPTTAIPVSTQTQFLCHGTATNIQLGSSQAGVSYQLRRDADDSPVGSAVAGTGAALLLPTSNLSATTTFNVLAVNTATGCSAELATTATANVNAAINVSAATPDNTICVGGSTALNASATGGSGSFSYAWLPSAELSNAATASATYTAGTAKTEIFTVTATDQDANYSTCSAAANMSVTSSALPLAAIPVSAQAQYLCHGTGTNIQLGSSQAGVSYQLRRDADDSPVGSAVAGTGAALLLPTGNLSATTTFNVLAVNTATGCSAELASTATVNVNAAINVSATTPDNTICVGGNTALNASATGGSGSFSYAWLPSGELSSAATASATYTAGTAKTEIFTVTATDQDANYSTCSATANVSVTSSALPLAAIPVSAQTQFLCHGTATNIQLGSSQAGVSYQLRRDADDSPVGSAVAGTGAALLLPTGNLSATTTFNVLAVNTATGCSAELATTAMVNVNAAMSVIASTSNSAICVGGSTSLIATPSGGSGSYNYSWTPAAELTGANMNVATYSPVASGSTLFNVVVSDANLNYAACTASGQVNISANALPNVVPIPPGAAICSGSSTNLNLTTSNGVSPVSYSWSIFSNPGGVTGASAGSGNLIAQSLTNPTDIIQTVVYRVTPTSGAGCPGATTDIAVDVYPQVTEVITNNSAAVCSGEAIDIDFTSPTANANIHLSAVYNGANGSVTYSGQNIGTTGTISETLVSTSASPVIVSYTFTASANGCVTSTETTNVVVGPAPVLNVVNNTPAICSGQNTDFILTSPTSGAQISLSAVNYGAVTGGAYAGGGGPFVSGFSIDETLTNPTNAPIVVTYALSVTAGACTGSTSTSVDVVVYPAPVFSVVNNTADICSGSPANIALSSPTSNALITLSNVNYGSASGSLTSGTTFTPGSTIGETLTNNTTAPTTVTYTFTVSANGCNNPATQQAVVNVDPVPALSISNNSTNICSGGQTDIDMASPTSGANIVLASVNYGAVTGGGYAAGNTFPAPANLAETLVNPTNVPITVTYVFSVEANGCNGPSTATANVVVYPAPALTITDNADIICSGQVTDIMLTSPVAGSVVELISVDYAGGNVTGGFGGGETFINGQRIREALTNTTTNIQTVSYTFRTTAPGCVPSADMVEMVTVNPAASLSLLNNAPEICEGAATDIVFNTPTENGQIRVVSVDYAAGNLTGGAISAGDVWAGSGSIAEILTNTTNSVQTVTYILEVLGNGCSPTEYTTAVQVQPAPAFTVNNNLPNICSGNAVNVALASPTAGALFTLDNVSYGATSGNLTSGATFTPGSTIGEMITNSTNAPATVTYTFSVSANGCVNPATQQAVVSVSPVPVLNVANNNAAFCSGGLTAIDVNSPTSAGSITLAAVNYGAVTGGAYAAGGSFVSPTTISETLVNPTNAPIIVSYVFDVDANGCTGSQKVTTVEVGPRPTIAATNPDICSGDNTNIIISNPNSVPFTQFLWTVLYKGPNIVSATPGTGSSITQKLTNTSNLVDSVIFRIQSDAIGCAGDMVDVRQIVNPGNTVFAGTDITVCEGTGSIQISDALMSGGASFPPSAWSVVNGSGSLDAVDRIDPTYLPAVGEIGTVTLLLTASDFTSCPDAIDYVDINILRDAFVFAGSDKVVCEGSTVTLAEAAAGGGTDSVAWTGGAGSFLPNNYTLNAIYVPDPTEYGTNVTLTITGFPVAAGPCPPSSDQVILAINAAPVVEAGTDQVLCEGAQAALVDASFGGGATAITWSGGSGNFLPDPNTLNATYVPHASEIGTTVVLTITTDDPAGPCGPATDIVRITINKAPEIYAGSDNTACEGSTVLLSEATIGGSATSVNWFGGAGTFTPTSTTLNAIYTPNTSEAASVVKLWVVTNDPAGPCTAVADTILLTIDTAPVVTAGADKVICEGDSVYLDDASLGGSATSVTWSGGAGSFYPNATTLNARYIPHISEIGKSVVLTLASNVPAGPCAAASDVVRVTVNRAPTVDAGTDRLICETSAANLNGTLGGSATAATWSTTGDGSFSFVGDLNASYTPGAADKAAGIVRLFITTNDPAGPCVAVYDSLHVQMDQRAIAIPGSYAPICFRDSIHLAGAIGGSGSSASWIGGSGTYINQNSLNAIYVPAPNEEGAMLTISLVTNDPAGPCPVDVRSTNVLVRSLPDITFTGLDPFYQIDDLPVVLEGFPTGGVFRGPGMAGNNFAPADAGEGVHRITYSYRDVNACKDSISRQTQVFPLPIVDPDIPENLCDNQNERTLPTDPNATDEWLGPNVFFKIVNAEVVYFFNAQNAGVGTHTVQYKFTDEFGVVVFKDVALEVNATPEISFTELNNCVTDPITFSNTSTLNDALGDDAIVLWEWKADNLFASDSREPSLIFDEYGDHIVSLTGRTKRGCLSERSEIVKIGAVPKVNFIVNDVAFGDFTKFSVMSKVPVDADDPSDSIRSAFWNFGDGNSTSGLAPGSLQVQNQYDNADTYDVFLEVVTDLGCAADTTISIAILPSVKSYPFIADFESDDGIGVISGINSSWQRGTPAGSVISGAYSGSGAFVTNLNGEYNANEKSVVNMPAFDLTLLDRPMLSMAIWSDAENQRDGSVLQYSTDGGRSWQAVKDDAELLGINYPVAQPEGPKGKWYDNKGLISTPGVINPATDTNEGAYGWTGKYSGWHIVRFPLDFIKDESSVRFRIAFGSDSQNAGMHDGFAFDYFWIGNRERLVLAEHFTNMQIDNNNIAAINGLINDLPLDLQTLQYHTSYVPDQIYNDNRALPLTRSLVYNLTQPPKTYLNGQDGRDNLEPYKIINEALEDARFNIEINIDPTAEPNTVGISVRVTPYETIDQDLIVYIATLEEMLDLNGTGLRNVIKDMLPTPGGTSMKGPWTEGETRTIEVVWNLNGLNIYNPDELATVVFIQNPKDEGTSPRRIYQTAYAKLPSKAPNPITGLEDDIVAVNVESIEMYPNPTADQLNVRFGGALTTDMRWRVVNQWGAEIYNGAFTSGFDHFQIDCTKLKNGLYMFMVEDEEKTYLSKRLVILR
jgi:hypothetical protein